MAGDQIGSRVSIPSACTVRYQEGARARDARGRLTVSKLPGEHQRLALDIAARLAIGRRRRGVVVVGKDPHSVTPFFASDVTQPFHERGADAVVSVAVVH